MAMPTDKPCFKRFPHLHVVIAESLHCTDCKCCFTDVSQAFNALPPTLPGFFETVQNL